MSSVLAGPVLSFLCRPFCVKLGTWEHGPKERQGGGHPGSRALLWEEGGHGVEEVLSKQEETSEGIWPVGEGNSETIHEFSNSAYVSGAWEYPQRLGCI